MKLKRPEPKSKIPPDAQRVFKGEQFEVYQWKQELFDGSTAIFEKIKRRDSVNVIPVLNDGKIVVTEQEQPAHTPFWSSAGGKCDEGEDPIACAKRELLEESGYEAGELILWNASQPSAMADWAIYTFIAKKCRKVTEPHPDAGEKINLHFLTFDEFVTLTRKPYYRDLEIALAVHRALGSKEEFEKLKLLFTPLDPEGQR